MIAINDQLPVKVQVKIQEKQLALLQRMDEGLQGHTGHTHRRLECRDGGAEIAPSKRPPSPSASSNIKRLRKLPRNKNGEIDVHELIKESRPPVTSVPHLEALLQPCCKAPFHQVRVA
jgi:hypothetical protein